MIFFCLTIPGVKSQNCDKLQLLMFASHDRNNLPSDPNSDSGFAFLKDLIKCSCYIPVAFVD